MRECNDTDVRLVGALVGYIDICLNGLWIPVCDAKWGNREAVVVCRQLGYNGSKLELTFDCCDNSLRLFINAITSQPLILCMNMMATAMR